MPKLKSILREFLDGEAAGGIILMVAAALALIVANSPLAKTYFAVLHAYLGPLSVSHWINDGLMAVFFLLVGLEIKREMLDGQLSTWPRRVLPGIAAAGGMAVPALVYVLINRDNAAALSGWAIPTATDIAFALGVLSLLGSRVPASLKVFLTALAIIDDLGAVVIIALFYTSGLSLAYLAAAFAIIALLVVLNRMRAMKLWGCWIRTRIWQAGSGPRRKRLRPDQTGPHRKSRPVTLPMHAATVSQGQACSQKSIGSLSLECTLSEPSQTIWWFPFNLNLPVLKTLPF